MMAKFKSLGVYSSIYINDAVKGRANPNPRAICCYFCCCYVRRVVGSVEPDGGDNGGGGGGIVMMAMGCRDTEG